MKNKLKMNSLKKNIFPKMQEKHQKRDKSKKQNHLRFDHQSRKSLHKFRNLLHQKRNNKDQVFGLQCQTVKALFNVKYVSLMKQMQADQA